MAGPGQVEVDVAAFVYGLVVTAATAATWRHLSVHGLASLRTRLTLVPLLLFVAAALSASFGFAATLVDSAAVSPCQVLVALSFAFDQIARVCLEQLLLWRIARGVALSLAVLVLQFLVLLRLVAGAVLVGFLRPQVRPSCMPHDSLVPLGISILVTDALFVFALPALALVLAERDRGVASLCAPPWSRGLLLIVAAFAIWTAAGAPLVLNIAPAGSSSLILRTVLPSLGQLAVIAALVLSKDIARAKATLSPVTSDSPAAPTHPAEKLNSGLSRTPIMRTKTTTSITAAGKTKGQALVFENGLPAAHRTAKDRIPHDRRHDHTDGHESRWPGKVAGEMPVATQTSTLAQRQAHHQDGLQPAGVSRRLEAFVSMPPGPSPSVRADHFNIHLNDPLRAHPYRLPKSSLPKFSDHGMKGLNGPSVRAQTSHLRPSRHLDVPPPVPALALGVTAPQHARARSQPSASLHSAAPQSHSRPSVQTRMAPARRRGPTSSKHVARRGLTRKRGKATARNSLSPTCDRLAFLSKGDLVLEPALSSCDSVIDRPRPISRRTSSDRGVFLGVDSPNLKSHRRSRSTGSLVGRRSVMQGVPEGPDLVPPFPPFLEASVYVPGRHAARSSVVSATVHQETPPGGARQARRSLSEGGSRGVSRHASSPWAQNTTKRSPVFSSSDDSSMSAPIGGLASPSGPVANSPTCQAAEVQGSREEQATLPCPNSHNFEDATVAGSDRLTLSRTGQSRKLVNKYSVTMPPARDQSAPAKTEAVLEPQYQDLDIWHYRIGEDCPTFSDRKGNKKRRMILPPFVLDLSRPSRPLILVETEPSPLESPEHALDVLQLQLDGLQHGVPLSPSAKAEQPVPLEETHEELTMTKEGWCSAGNEPPNMPASAAQSASSKCAAADHVLDISPQTPAASPTQRRQGAAALGQRVVYRQPCVAEYRSRKSYVISDYADGTNLASPTPPCSDDSGNEIVLGRERSDADEPQPTLWRPRPSVGTNESPGVRAGFLWEATTIPSEPSPRHMEPAEGSPRRAARREMSAPLTIQSRHLWQAAPHAEKKHSSGGLWSAAAAAQRAAPALVYPNESPEAKACLLWAAPTIGSEPSPRRVEPAKGSPRRAARRELFAPLTVQSRHLWQAAPRAEKKHSSGGLWSAAAAARRAAPALVPANEVAAVPRKAVVRPLRKPKPFPSLPDILEHPEPLLVGKPDTPDAMGIFRLPSGQLSSHVPVEQLGPLPFPQPPPSPGHVAGGFRPRENGGLASLASFYDQSSGPAEEEEEADDDDDDDDDDFDETTLWEIVSLLNPLGARAGLTPVLPENMDDEALGANTGPQDPRDSRYDYIPVVLDTPREGAKSVRTRRNSSSDSAA